MDLKLSELRVGESGSVRITVTSPSAFKMEGATQVNLFPLSCEHVMVMDVTRTPKVGETWVHVSGSYHVNIIFTDEHCVVYRGAMLDSRNILTLGKFYETYKPKI